MLEANLGMVTGEGISEMVIFKLGSNVRRETASKRRASRGERSCEGPTQDKGWYVWGMERSPVCQSTMGEGQTGVYRRLEGRTWLIHEGLLKGLNLL